MGETPKFSNFIIETTKSPIFLLNIDNVSLKLSSKHFLIGKYEMSFDIALHFGTLMAILVYFFKDFMKMLKEGFTKGTKTKYGKLLWYVVAATIPAAVVGVLLEDKIDELVRSNYILICAALSIMGILIYLADKYSEQSKTFEDMKFKDAIIIGCSQICALIPGFSRSGTTILTARLMGLSKKAATKFTFLLSVPITNQISSIVFTSMPQPLSVI